MASFHSQDWYTIIKKHYILTFAYMLKFVCLIVFSLFLLSFSLEYRIMIWEDVTRYVFFPIIFLMFNYSFSKLILGFIEYYHYLFIIKDDQIFIINCSLILRDDIEVIDSFKIIKIDSFSRWFFSNIIWYWTIVIELQSRETRSFRFMPNPYRLIKLLEEQRDSVLLDRKKKYIAVHEWEDKLKPLEVNLKWKVSWILK